MIKRAWNLSKTDQNILEVARPELRVEGDGKAEFIGQGTEEEYRDFELQEKGMKGWIDRLKQL